MNLKILYKCFLINKSILMKCEYIINDKRYEYFGTGNRLCVNDDQLPI